ncbi:MAG: alpha/beta hydrolase [Mycobacteriaceae bacterium]|nr:alpha/beta hydrolase [Mycobacteriaceae bacterium]
MRFPEIAGRTSRVSIPTRYGEAAADVYHPTDGAARPPVYVNVHGGGFVVGHPEQDDPWCRYLAANAGAVVLNADGIGGIAPALVITAEHDRLRDEARTYADKLQAAGALAEYYEVPGVDHGYNIMSDATDVTRDTYAHIARHVERATTS